MKKTLSLAVVVLAVGLTQSGCGKIKSMIGGEPKGQVVATVNGDEITSLELRQELGNFSSRDPKIMRAAQQQALQRLIMKRIVVQKAKEEKLDKTPEYAQQVRRGEEGLLLQSYQRKLAQSAGTPTRDEAQAFVASHPEKFSARKVLVVEQVIAQQSPKITPDKIQPLKTIQDVKALYDSLGVQAQSNVATLDTLQLPDQMIAAIDKLPAGEVFVVPQQDALVFNRILDARSAPLTGDMAVAYATNVLRNQKAQEAIARQMELLRKGADKQIVYNSAYKTLAPPPQAAATPAAKR